jgi:TctA family transporter
MDILNMIHIGLVSAFQPMNLLYCFIGVFIGTMIGVLPGIGSAGTIAILMPVTFGLPSVSRHHHAAGIIMALCEVHHLILVSIQ